MRQIAQPPCPAALDGPNSPGAVEIAKATRYYAATPPPAKAFPHKAYKDDSVRASLNEAFDFKCAYCESSYGETQPVDIEHYRPKGEVTTAAGSIKPGYFWLAATWNNLLPSCIDCNRERTYPGRDGHPQKLGKGNKFPLERESDRVMTPGADVSGEGTLLLNPYQDDPERHLEFFASGAARPSLDPSNPSEEDLKGRTTIDVAGLNRPRLARAREGHARRVKMQLWRVARAEARFRENSDDGRLRVDLRLELHELRKLKSPESPYLALTAQMIERRRRSAA